MIELMVLPQRLELWTSPLPRGCSTTELRQRMLWNAADGATRLRREASAFPDRSRRPLPCGTTTPTQIGATERDRKTSREWASILSSNSEKKGRRGRDASGAGANRLEREADALRANLARRKAQQRQRRDADEVRTTTAGPDPKPPADKD